MTAPVRDHRKRADIPIPRGGYARARSQALGLPMPTATPSVFQLVAGLGSVPAGSGPAGSGPAGSVPAGSGSVGSGPVGGTGPVVRDHRRSPGATHTRAGTRVTTGHLPDHITGVPSDLTAIAAVQRSTVDAVPGQPPGFGQVISWVGDEDLAVVAFVTASQPFGVGVSGVTDGDTFELVNAVGNATFDQDTDNAGVSGLITIVAAGASLTAAAFGAPELAPIINGAGAALAQQFPEQQHNAKPRDVFGQIAGSSEFARAEGGLIVCSPDALGIFESGDSDHQNRWIRSSTDRRDEHRPPHVFAAFFLQRDRQPRVLDGDGDLIIAPWDHKFEDNVGVYRVEFILRRGTRPPAPPVP